MRALAFSLRTHKNKKSTSAWPSLFELLLVVVVDDERRKKKGNCVYTPVQSRKRNPAEFENCNLNNC